MQTGWLAPNGDFYPCDTYDHSDVATSLVRQLNLPIGWKYHEDEVLLESGWVKISRSAVGVKEQKVYWDNFLTDYQKNFLRPYFEENDIPMCGVCQTKWDKEDK